MTLAANTTRSVEGKKRAMTKREMRTRTRMTMKGMTMKMKARTEVVSGRR
jgi:hypothetical protein